MIETIIIILLWEAARHYLKKVYNHIINNQTKKSKVGHILTEIVITPEMIQKIEQDLIIRAEIEEMIRDIENGE